ncbi:hypothetical protein E4U42_007005 [Claviceps africana]|uniref:Uncharacterized protein n=1 Tax=Claviceps africana TaxID=83212 RepID=A0A8K0J1X1_9HYPO|nr:hypothetical protein E4U42_007005 [Claviceps africana]
MDYDNVGHRYETRGSFHKLLSRIDANDAQNCSESSPSLHSARPGFTDGASGQFSFKNDEPPEGDTISSLIPMASPGSLSSTTQVILSSPSFLSNRPNASLSPSPSSQDSISRTTLSPSNSMGAARLTSSKASSPSNDKILPDPSSDDPSSDDPSSNYPSSNYPSSNYPSSNYPSSDDPSSDAPLADQKKTKNWETSSEANDRKDIDIKAISDSDDILGPFAHELQDSTREKLRRGALALRDKFGEVCPLLMAQLFWANSTLGASRWPELDQGERSIKRLRKESFDLERVKERREREDAYKREMEESPPATERNIERMRNKRRKVMRTRHGRGRVSTDVSLERT